MSEKMSALYSEYIIDGVKQELTPAQMLWACLSPFSSREVSSRAAAEPVIDETVDPALKPCVTDPSYAETYWKSIKALKSREFPSDFPESYTKSRISLALIDAIWRKGHFRLGDLALNLAWHWRSEGMGSMANFYFSASSAADFIDSLGLRIDDFSFASSGDDSRLDVSPVLLNPGPDDAVLDDSGAPEPDFFPELPFRTGHPKLCLHNLLPSKFIPDPQSWLIYIPFEHCEYRLGASLLAQVLGASGLAAPQIVDADYFIDCYEVVRELVEDRVALAGITVGDGGLYSALRRMAGRTAGAGIDLSGLVGATGEKDLVRLLFAEVPGVLIQIADLDYDYVDAELLLQDVAFYPLGHPAPGVHGVEIRSSEKSGIQTILESLILSQSSEGED